MQIDPYHIHYRAVKVCGCTGFAGVHFRQALSMIAERASAFKKLLSHYFTLEQAEEAFALLKSGHGMKVVIRM